MRLPLAAPFLFLALVSSIRPAPAHAERSGFAFLRLPVSARSAGMGESGVALFEGASAFYLNPAALAPASGPAASHAPWGVAGEALLTHHESFGDLHQDAVVLDLQKGIEALAVGFNSFYSGAIEQTDEVGNPLGNFGVVDMAVDAAYARSLSPALRVGVSAGYVRDRVADAVASTWSAGGGVRWQPAGVKGLALGASLRHVGGSARFKVDGAPGERVGLPTAAQAGASYSAGWRAQGHWAVSADVKKARDEGTTGHAGIEAGWSAVALRAGTRLGTGVGHFTAGLGLESGRFRLDYAFLPSGEGLGTSHRFELGARFGL